MPFCNLFMERCSYDCNRHSFHNEKYRTCSSLDCLNHLKNNWEIN